MRDRNADDNGDGDMLDSNDCVRYYTTDANHNVTATINGATGNVVDRYSYTVYGQATVYDPDWTDCSNWIGDGPLYCGYFYDSETANPSTGAGGNYQVRNRYYSAELGRFVSRDPIGFEAKDENLYSYVSNSPLMNTDHTGLKNDPECIDICEAARQNSSLTKGGKSRGGVVCQGGIKCACVFDWPDEGIKVGKCPKLDRIIEKHEENHKKDVDCENTCQPYRPDYRNPKMALSRECWERNDSIIDLNKAIKIEENPKCKEAMEKLRNEVDKWVKENCKNVVGVP